MNSSIITENHSANGNLNTPLEPGSVPQKPEALRKVLRQHSGERHLVIIQDFPDPDALSSAWAYALIAEQFEIDCDIVYGGTLSHQENIALVKLTNLPVQRWPLEAAKKKNFSNYNGCVFLDSQGTTSQLTSLVLEAQIPVIVLIDHHSLQHQDFKPEFIDIRPQIKATATILVQYLQAGLVEFDGNNTTHVNCATALMHGLRADTNHLRQAGREEFLAAAYLSQFYDSALLDAVLRSARSKRVMDVIERALSNRKIQDNVSISGVGYLRANDRDAIPQAADFLLTEENVHTAVVYGIVYDDFNEVEIVTGSLRTNKITLDPDEFIKEAFGTDATGKFFGGGRSQAGGFEIPLGFLSGFSENKDYSETKWKVYDTQVKQKLVRLVNPD